MDKKIIIISGILIAGYFILRKKNEPIQTPEPEPEDQKEILEVVAPETGQGALLLNEKEKTLFEKVKSFFGNKKVIYISAAAVSFSVIAFLLRLGYKIRKRRREAAAEKEFAEFLDEEYEEAEKLIINKYEDDSIIIPENEVFYFKKGNEPFIATQFILRDKTLGGDTITAFNEVFPEESKILQNNDMLNIPNIQMFLRKKFIETN